jgi:hypothetical protein
MTRGGKRPLATGLHDALAHALPLRARAPERVCSDERRARASSICMQIKLELVILPVADVDRSKAFYPDLVVG